MKKLSLLFLFTLTLSITNVFGQARQELNFGLIGVNYEIPVHEDITIAPAVATDFNLDWITVGVKANYYFDKIFEITDSAWDVYGGANIGYAFYSGRDDYYYYDGYRYSHNYDNDLDLGLQVGARWFWNDKWGVYAEIAGGSIRFIPTVGITMKL